MAASGASRLTGARKFKPIRVSRPGGAVRLESLRLWRRFWRQSDDMFFRLNVATGLFEHASPALGRVFGWPLAEVLATPNFLFQVVHPEDREKVLA